MTLILPKRIELDKAKTLEQKREIDNGVALYKRIGELREMKTQMETNFEVWRREQVKAIQIELDVFIEQRNAAEEEATRARQRRDELLKPILKEINEAKEETRKATEARNKLFLEKEIFAKEVKEFNEEKKKVKLIIQRAKKNEQETETAKISIQNLQEATKLEYETARKERDVQTKEHETKLLEVNQKIQEYKVALDTIEVREQQIKDKESELLLRENDLTRRLKNLQRAEEQKK